MTSVPINATNNFIDNIDLKMEEALNNGPPLHVNGQSYALIIYLSPQGTSQRNIEAGMMILGTFKDEPSARAHIDKLARMGYVFFDIFIVQMYAFFPLPPPTDMANSEYINSEMNKIMAYHRNAVVADQADVERRVEECRADEESKAKARVEQKANGGCTVALLPESSATAEEKKKGEEKAIVPKRQCTEEERQKLRVVMGEPIFVDEKDIPAGANVIDISQADFDKLRAEQK